MSVLGSFVLPHPPLLVPDVGCGEELVIGETLRSTKAIADKIAFLKPDTIILTSPHAPYLGDAFFIDASAIQSGSLAQFGAPQVKLSFETDLEFVQALAKINPNLSPALDRKGLDHATIVPMFYVTQAYDTFKFVRIGLSGLSRQAHIELGQQIQAVAESLGKRIVFIASGDLSHRLKADGPYGLHPSGAKFDKSLTELLSQGKLAQIANLAGKLCDEAGECGYRSVLILSGVMTELKYHSKLHSYEGPFGVGYACASFIPLRDPYVALAKMAIRNIVLDYLKTIVPTNTPAHLLNEKAGVFVSIHKHGKLRGCIGTIAPSRPNVAQEIIQCAIWAATEDYRFTPIMPEELDALSVHVDVLNPAEKIDSEDQLDPRTYGVIVTKGGRRGLLLPDLEGIDTARDQVNIALQKAGIYPDEAYSLERFTVTRHHD